MLKYEITIEEIKTGNKAGLKFCIIPTTKKEEATTIEKHIGNEVMHCMDTITLALSAFGAMTGGKLEKYKSTEELDAAIENKHNINRN